MSLTMMGGPFLLSVVYSYWRKKDMLETSPRKVKWSQEAADFWNSAKSKSVVLQFVVSYGCVSQTEKGLEDLVNTLNEPFLQEKIKKIVITDTSYLYRHCIPEFNSYSDPVFPTVWYLNNELTIKQLKIDTELVSWADGLKKTEFKEWHKKILADFDGNGDDSRIVRSFRDRVFMDSTLSAYKGNYEMQGCIDFMLEECAYACAFLNNSDLLYPMNLARCMEDAFERYGISANLLNYKTSRYAQKHTKYRDSRFDMLDKEIAIFMKEKVSNVNFFVIDNDGNHIYKNYALQQMVGDVNAKELAAEAWENNLEVMKSRQLKMFEERYMDKVFLAVKSPLIVDDEVEGVIGLAVDVTAAKEIEFEKAKARELEFSNSLQEAKIKLQDEFVRFISQMAHDITSPLVCLRGFGDLCDNLTVSQKELLNNITASIQSIANDLLEKYKGDKKKLEEISKSEEVSLCCLLQNIVQQKRIEYGSRVKFDFSHSLDGCPAHVAGRSSDFERMISNLLNNAVEASSDGGLIKIRLMPSSDKKHILLIVEDSGTGMSKEQVAMLMDKKPLSSSKKEGFGLGLLKVLQTIEMYNGELQVVSEKGSGTKFTITFPLR